MNAEELLPLLPDYLKDLDPEIYLSNNYVVVDFETTILDKGSPYNEDNRIVCSTWRVGSSHPEAERYNDTQYNEGNEFNQQRLVRAIEQADFFIAHNSKFEYGWLRRCGLELHQTPAFCTMIGEYILRSNRRGSLTLDDCLKRRRMDSKELLGGSLLKAGVCPSTWPQHWLRPYAIKDVVQGEKLFLHQRQSLRQANQLRTAFIRNLLTPVLVDIESLGMHIDADRVKILHANYTLRKEELAAQIDVITGGANPRSVPQMREVLYDKLKFRRPTDKRWLTPKGEPTTSFDYINTLKPKTQKQIQFKKLKQEYSKVDAALTKALNKFSDCCRETDDHIITASLNQTITATQRLSSTGRNYKAQFQNFPRIFKPLFSARNEGWEVGEIDQAQLEYRVAVWYGQDEAGIYDINHKVDSHAFTATHIYGDSFTQLTPSDQEYKAYRTRAKAHTFKPLFGGESGTKDEVRYYKAFKEKHVGITAAQQEWIRQAVNTKKVNCPNGLIFYFPDAKVTNSGYITSTTNICNYNVQSLATADIVPIGVVFMWHLFRVAKLKSFIVNTVHDSVITEVYPPEKKIISEIGELSNVFLVKDTLKKVYDIDFNVPLEVETQFAKNWSDTAYWREQYLNLNEKEQAYG